MTTTEHLQRIRARCVELLAIAEKRTQGEWRASLQNPNRQFSHTVGATGGFLIAYQQMGPNAAFIASCAGPAEAGWRSTIAAIDGLNRTAQLLRDEGDTALAMAVESELEAIIAAWPEDLL